jgi:molecular chaperone GrpE
VAATSAATDIVDNKSEAERQRDEYLDSLQRLQADFENYRKRVARSSDDAATRAAGDLVAKLLPVLDAFDLAQAHFTNAQSDEAAALSQSRGLLLDTLAKEGLVRIDAVGVAFDPQIHDAVAHIDADAGEEQVIDGVLRAGYLWKGAVLRPAMVRVKG